MRIKALVERSTAQRSALIAGARPVLEKAAAVDRVVAHVRRYPVLTSVAVGAVALAGPRKIFDLGTRILAFYALLKR